MKKHIMMLATLLCLCETVQLMGMSQITKEDLQKVCDGQLNFSLNTNREIISWSNENMAFFAKPSEFDLKDILTTLPLAPEDLGKFENAFKDAMAKKETIKTPCTIEQKRFLATITPTLCNRGAGIDFFIKMKKFPEQTHEKEFVQKEPKARLNFSLDSTKSVFSWSQEGTQLCSLPNNIEYRPLGEVLPLDPENRNKLLETFNEAKTKRGTAKVLLTLQTKQVLASITALKTSEENEEIDFFVKITEN